MLTLTWCPDSPYCQIVKWWLLHTQAPHAEVRVSWGDLKHGHIEEQSPTGLVPFLQDDHGITADSFFIVGKLTNDAWRQSSDALLFKTIGSEWDGILKLCYHIRRLDITVPPSILDPYLHSLLQTTLEPIGRLWSQTEEPTPGKISGAVFFHHIQEFNNKFIAWLPANLRQDIETLLSTPHAKQVFPNPKI